ncbi:hypothetical protein FKM82_023022 [Ascaphus truei]
MKCLQYMSNLCTLEPNGFYPTRATSSPTSYPDVTSRRHYLDNVRHMAANQNSAMNLCLMMSPAALFPKPMRHYSSIYIPLHMNMLQYPTVLSTCTHFQLGYM